MFRSRFDNLAVKALLNGKNEVKYFNDIPLAISANVNSILDYLQIPKDMVIPDVTIKTGGRQEKIIFDHPEGEDYLMRILVNLGPDDNFRLYKETKNKMMAFEEFTLLNGNGVPLNKELNEHHIVLPNYTKKNIIRNGKKVCTLRRSDHVSMVLVITLWINTSYKVEKEEIGPQIIRQEETKEEKPFSGIIERI